jgi:quercetin dioxygenase-like cupin family protein
MSDHEKARLDEQAINKAANEYHARGLLTGIFEEEPHSRSEAHRHGAATLLTISGAARIRLDDQPWQDVSAGTEVTVADNQLHEVVAGPEGWKYLFACSPAEAQKQEILDQMSGSNEN